MFASALYPNRVDSFTSLI